MDRVGAIARDLTGLCKVYWPGSVYALQLNATPANACGDFAHRLGASPPDSWAAAAELAGRALEAVVEHDVAEGRDEYGWADAAALAPAPVDPESDVAALRHEVEAVTGPVDAPPPKVRPAGVRSPGPKDLARYLEWGRLARWLRGAVVDFEMWSRVAGRLRWLAARIGARDDRLANVLNPAFRPPTTWAAALGRDPVEQRRKRDRSALHRRRLALDPADAAGVQAWVRDALDLFDKDAIVGAVRPFRDAVLAIRPEEFTGRRTHRSRLRGVQTALRADDLAAPAAGATLLVAPDDAAVAPEQPAVDPGEDLFARVRPHTAGRTVAFVSNRADPELEAMLRGAFGFREIDWCEGTPRRVQAVEDRIGQGGYDLVRAATGFQSHCVDGALYRTCKKAGIPYVRVNKGRPVTCAAAIARRLRIAVAA